MKSRKLVLVIGISITVLIFLSTSVLSATKSEVNISLITEFSKENCTVILVGKDA